MLTWLPVGASWFILLTLCNLPHASNDSVYIYPPTQRCDPLLLAKPCPWSDTLTQGCSKKQMWFRMRLKNSIYWRRNTMFGQHCLLWELCLGRIVNQPWEKAWEWLSWPAGRRKSETSETQQRSIKSMEFQAFLWDTHSMLGQEGDFLWEGRLPQLLENTPEVFNLSLHLNTTYSA